MFIILLCKIISALKEIVIAHRYGTNELVDAYQFSITMAIFIPNAMMNALISLSVPLFINIRHTSHKHQKRFFQEMQTHLLFISLLISCILFLLWPFISSHAIKAQNSPYFMEYADIFFQAFCFLAPCIVLSGLYIARLRADKIQIDSFLEIIPPLILLIWLLLTWKEGSSITPLLYGTVIGFILNFAFLKIKAEQSCNIKIGIFPALKKNTAYWNGLYRKMGIIFFCQLAVIMIQPIDQYMAANFPGSANAILGYSDRLLYLAISLGGVALARVALPFFSELHIKKSKEIFYLHAIKYSTLAVFFGSIAACVMWLLSPWIVQIIFERGAFTAENTIQVSNTLRWGCLQMIFCFSAILLMQIYYSANRHLLILIATVTGIAIKLIISLLFHKIQLEGLMLATAAMYFAIWIFLLISSIISHRMQIQ